MIPLAIRCTGTKRSHAMHGFTVAEIGRFLERIPFMTNYSRFIPPPSPSVGTETASVFTSLMAVRLRNIQVERQKAQLNDWEDEGGSVPATDAALS